MEGKEDTTKTEAQLASTAAFMDGGIQDACDDACSICLEVFCETDPSTVISCKHEFHLRCILEWQAQLSEELLDAAKRESDFDFNPLRDFTRFSHIRFEELVMWQFAPDFMQAYHIARRMDHQTRSSITDFPYFQAFFEHMNFSPPPSGPVPSSLSRRGEGEPTPAIIVDPSSSPRNSFVEDSLQLNSQPPSSQLHQVSPESNVLAINQRSPNESYPSGQGRAEPSELQTFSKSLKARLNIVLTRYKESISKSIMSWKERFFSCNTFMADR